MKDILEKIKKDIISDIKEFEFINELMSLEVKFNKAVDRYSVRIIALSTANGAIVFDLFLDNEQCIVKLDDEKIDVEEVKELFDYLNKNYSKKLEDVEFQKYIINGVFPEQKNKVKKTKKRL